MYALSGVGMVVLYRTTGVLNLAFGAVGAMGALIAWQMINEGGWTEGPAYLACVLFGGAVTLAYGFIFGPPLAGRDPLVKATATLGLALILLGTMSWIWSDKARSMILPTTTENFKVGDVLVNYTQVLGLAFGVVVTVGTAVFLRSRSSAPRCARWPTTARSPPRWACRCGAWRPPPGWCRA